MVISKHINWNEALGDTINEKREAVYVALVHMMETLHVQSVLMSEDIAEIFEQMYGSCVDDIGVSLLPFKIGGVKAYKSGSIEFPIIYINHTDGIATLYVEDFMYNGSCTTMVD